MNKYMNSPLRRGPGALSFRVACGGVFFFYYAPARAYASFHLTL